MSEMTGPTVDDVLDAYLHRYAEAEAGIDPLPEMIALYPQYSDELQEIAALMRIGEKLPEPEYTEAQIEWLNQEAIRVVHHVLAEQRASAR